MVPVSCIGVRGEPAVFFARIFRVGEFLPGRGNFLAVFLGFTGTGRQDTPHPPLFEYTITKSIIPLMYLAAYSFRITSG
jgi:hypothetical protein